MEQQSRKNIGYQFEDKAIAAFQNAGWDACSSQNQIHDITLFFNNEEFGFVDLFYNLNEERFESKLKRAKQFVSTSKPNLFIVTNLVSFYVSRNGGPFEKTYYMPTPKGVTFSVLNNSKEKSIVSDPFSIKFYRGPEDDINQKEINEQLGWREWSIKQCQKDFGKNVWEKLDLHTQEHLISSTCLFEKSKELGIDIGSIIFGLAESFECEIKKKIFNNFNSLIKPKLDSFKDWFDDNYVDALKNGNFVPVSECVRKMEYIGYRNPRGISKELADYLFEEWDILGLSKKEFINNAKDLIKVRNNMGHGSVEYESKKYQEAHNKTKYVLRWFIDCMR